MSDRKEPVQALPGDLVQITAPGHQFRAAIAMVREVHRWGIGVAIPAIVDGKTAEAYERLKAPRGNKPGEFAIVGSAVLMPPEVYKARAEAIETARLAAQS